MDSYYRDNLKVYLDAFCNKYEDANKYVDHLNIVEELQKEAIEIFKNLMNYCKNDVKYIIDNIKGLVCNDGMCEGVGTGGTGGTGGNHKLLERKHIMDYLKFNNINL